MGEGGDRVCNYCYYYSTTTTLHTATLILPRITQDGGVEVLYYTKPNDAVVILGEKILHGVGSGFNVGGDGGDRVLLVLLVVVQTRLCM